MSSKDGQGGEKTEKATPRKLKKARKDGQVGNTPEVGAWLGMLAATFVLPYVFGTLMDVGTTLVVSIGRIIRQPDMEVASSIFREAGVDAVWAIMPMAALIAVIGVAGVAVQGGIWFSPKLLAPKLNKLNPLKGFKRMFGPQGLWQLVKSLIKSLALMLVVFLSVKNLLPTVYASGTQSLSSLINIAARTAVNVLRFAALAGLALAVADIAVVRRRNNKELKMSKYEVKQEHKSQEGDPYMKSSRRAKARSMSQNRMMRQVPHADVVLVNPTHVAVALKYEAGQGAPTVVAKGADHVAARIRELAKEHRIPMVQDVPLARTLYHSCEIGQEIPSDLYKAVAMVLAFIMTLKSRGSAAGTHKIDTRTPMPA